MAGEIIIRPLVPGDAAELASLFVESRTFLAPFEPFRADSFFTATGQRERIEGWLPFGFAVLAGDRIAGEAVLSNVHRDALQSASLGFWVAERYNGRGLATRAVGDVVEVAFGELGLHRVEAATLTDNARSQRVLVKNGFEENVAVVYKMVRI